MCSPADEFFVQRDALSTEGAIFWSIGGKVPTHKAEDRLVIELDGRATPETADADHVRAELLHEADEQVQRATRRHQILDEEHVRARPDQPLELDRKCHAAFAP